MNLKKVAVCLVLHNAAAGVGTALPPYKHRRGFFARGGGFAIGNTGPSEEIEALAGESFDWLANLGAPAALVAGAVIAAWAVPQTSAIVSVFRLVIGESFGVYSRRKVES